MSIKEKERKRFHCPAGKRYAHKHAITIDDNGHKTLTRTGEMVDTYAIIQSHFDECDLERILERANVEGMEILDRKAAMIGDVTAIPKSMLEAAQLMQNVENDFNHLPLNTRRKFNFSFEQYLAAANKDPKEWATKMGYIEKPKPTIQPTAPTEIPTITNEGGEQ